MRLFQYVSLATILLGTSFGYAATVCSGQSEIDQPERFIYQLYTDVLDRATLDGDSGVDTNLKNLKDQIASQCRNLGGDALETCRLHIYASTVEGFMKSPEFISRQSKLNLASNRDFVLVVYRKLFRRDPDSEGHDFWTHRLNTGLSRADFIYGFLSGEHYRNRFSCTEGNSAIDGSRFFVEQLYRDLFKRNPSQDVIGVNPKIAAIDVHVANTCKGTSGKKLFLCRWQKHAQVAFDAINSDEYRRKRPDVSTTQGFVKSLYEDIYNRSPDPGSIEAWTREIDSGRKTRFSLLSSFLYGENTEYRRRFIWRNNRHFASTRPLPGPETVQVFPAGSLTIRAGEATDGSIGVALRVTHAGDLQVFRTQDKVVLWHTNTDDTTCTPTKCYLLFQGDGHLILYGSNGKPVWFSNTGGRNGSALTLSPKESYITIRDRYYKVSFETGGTPTPTMLMDGLAKVNQAQASSTQSFINTMGIGTHIDQGTDRNTTILLGQLNYLGISTIREHADPLYSSQLKTVMDAGIKISLIHNNASAAAIVKNLETIVKLKPGGVVAIEGPNEINNFPVSCDGLSYDIFQKDTEGNFVFQKDAKGDLLVDSSGQPIKIRLPTFNGGPAAQCLMTQMYQGVKNSSILKHLPVFHLTSGYMAVNAAKYGLLTLKGQADYANIHPYPTSGNQPRAEMLGNLSGAYFSATPSKTVITETGYTTDLSNKNGVSETAQAIMNLNIFFDAFQAGIHKTFLYTMSDDHESFGLYRKDDTAKPAAVAIHNLTTILKDTGVQSTFQPRSLRYSLGKLPDKIYSMLLQKTNGNYYLVIWNEEKVWDGRQDLNIEKEITLDLGKIAKTLKVFSPVDSDKEAHSLANVNKYKFRIGAKPLIIEIKQ
tara:strand:+ start:365 stop:2998 length:2634 start_codon:yes stop_codon:yes gene_type:complete